MEYAGEQGFCGVKIPSSLRQASSPFAPGVRLERLRPQRRKVIISRHALSTLAQAVYSLSQNLALVPTPAPPPWSVGGGGYVEIDKVYPELSAH